MVVPVLITNCHVSLYPKMGPVIAHATMVSKAAAKAQGCPMATAEFLANRENKARSPLAPLACPVLMVVTLPAVSARSAVE
jgi:hypothetical protein